jgi:hypothetical protein
LCVRPEDLYLSPCAPPHCGQHRQAAGVVGQAAVLAHFRAIDRLRLLGSPLAIVPAAPVRLSKFKQALSYRSPIRYQNGGVSPEIIPKPFSRSIIALAERR